MIKFCRQESNPEALIIKKKEGERVETFKYLGVVLDNNITWKNNTDVIIYNIKNVLLEESKIF